MHDISTRSNRKTMLRFIHKKQASPANTHKPVMNISIKKLNKFNNEANTEKNEG